MENEELPTRILITRVANINGKNNFASQFGRVSWLWKLEYERIECFMSTSNQKLKGKGGVLRRKRNKRKHKRGGRNKRNCNEEGEEKQRKHKRKKS